MKLKTEPRQGTETVTSHTLRVSDPRGKVKMMERNDFAFFEKDRQAYEYEQECPVCDECGEAITDSDDFYMVHGECYCEQCMDSMRMRVDEYIRERATA